MSNDLQLAGVHHVSARTRHIGANHDFSTRVLNLRLVKKSVNQDDLRMYHLFYADAVGTPGSGMTFFDFPRAAPEHKGNDSISRTTFRLTVAEAFSFWAERLTAEGVAHSGIVTVDGRRHLHFEDGDGTPLSLVEDGGSGPRGVPRPGSDVPDAFQIQGLGYSGITVSNQESVHDLLERGLNLREARQYPVPGAERFFVHVYAMGAASESGPHGELHVTVRDDLPRFQPGAGGVHHVALRIPDAVGIQPWLDHLEREGFSNTGLVDRFYFQSVYLRAIRGIVIELATDGPGFHADESIEQLGEQLALPPFLENRRSEIETNLRPIVSKRAN